MLGPALTLLGSGGQVPGWTSGPLAWGPVRFAACRLLERLVAEVVERAS